MASISRSKRPLLLARKTRVQAMREAYHDNLSAMGYFKMPEDLEFFAATQWGQAARGLAESPPAHEPPPEGADTESPWWVIVSGLDYLGIKNHCVLALPAQGAAAPDWNALAQAACSRWINQASACGFTEKFDQAIDNAEHRLPSLAPRELSLNGRCAWIHARAPFDWVFAGAKASKKIVQTFDARRARRRRTKSAPAALERVFGQAASALWKRGASMAATPHSPLPFDWAAQALDALAHALRDAGALAAWPLSAPWEPPQDFLRSPEAFESFEREQQDPLRASWALRQAAAPAPAAPRRAL
jgi:hypothetical protein